VEILSRITKKPRRLALRGSFRRFEGRPFRATYRDRSPYRATAYSPEPLNPVELINSHRTEAGHSRFREELPAYAEQKEAPQVCGLRGSFQRFGEHPAQVNSSSPETANQCRAKLAEEISTQISPVGSVFFRPSKNRESGKALVRAITLGAALRPLHGLLAPPKVHLTGSTDFNPQFLAVLTRIAGCLRYGSLFVASSLSHGHAYRVYRLSSGCPR
jgi:hypothetical protein